MDLKKTIDTIVQRSENIKKNGKQPKNNRSITPGPWSVISFDLPSNQSTIITSAKNGNIAWICRDIIYDENFRSEVGKKRHLNKVKKQELVDANLISAAPEMYEALKNLENEDNSIPDSIWTMVKSAINKAEGVK